MPAERFLRYLQFEKKFSSHTLLSYRKDLAQFADFLQNADLNLQTVNHTHIRSWMVQLLDEGLSAKTINRKISCLRSLYKFLLRERVVSHNPLTQVRTPKVPKQLPVFIEEQKIDNLLDSEDIFGDDFDGIRNRLIIELLYGTGIRLAELIGLDENKVDCYEKQIKVLGKRSKERIIPIHAPLVKLILQYLEVKNAQTFDTNSPALIVINNGKRAYPNFIYRVVKKYLAIVSTKEKQGPHSLRHSFATAMLNRGADLNAIKELLGHASLAATQVYTHTSVERLKAIYKQAHPKA